VDDYDERHAYPERVEESTTREGKKDSRHKKKKLGRSRMRKS